MPFRSIRRRVRPRPSPTRSFEPCGSTGSTTSRRSSWAGDPFSVISETWSEKALEPGEAAWLLDYRRYLDRVDKVCLSHRLTSTDWQNSRILGGDLAEVLAKLKGEEGGNIILEGGPAVVRECLRRNLADDYWFFVMPVVYGKGPRYWGPMDGQTTLSLVETKPGKNREILLHYEAVR